MIPNKPRRLQVNITISEAGMEVLIMDSETHGLGT